MIRVAAVGDVHVEPASALTWAARLAPVTADADLLLLAGDLTRTGTIEETAAVVEALQDVAVPRVAVLGNHDHHAGHEADVTRLLAEAGVVVLEGSSATFEIRGIRIGIAGSKGFGGGFAGACGSDFGEEEMKRFIRHTKDVAGRLRGALAGLDADVRVALLHYSPVPDTLQGERLEIYPFLGSYLLAEAIDEGGADLVVHGHAHGGVERGVTPGGIRVRNVAVPVIKRAYSVFCFAHGHDTEECGARSAISG